MVLHLDPDFVDPGFLLIYLGLALTNMFINVCLPYLRFQESALAPTNSLCRRFQPSFHNACSLELVLESFSSLLLWDFSLNNLFHWLMISFDQQLLHQKCSPHLLSNYQDIFIFKYTLFLEQLWKLIESLYQHCCCFKDYSFCSTLSIH